MTISPESRSTSRLTALSLTLGGGVLVALTGTSLYLRYAGEAYRVPHLLLDMTGALVGAALLAHGLARIAQGNGRLGSQARPGRLGLWLWMGTLSLASLSHVPSRPLTWTAIYLPVSLLLAILIEVMLLFRGRRPVSATLSDQNGA